MRHPLASSLVLASVVAAACSSPPVDAPTGSTTAAVIGNCATPPDPTRSLFVTDLTALANFSMQALMNQIAATGSTTGQTGRDLYAQMMDTLHTKAQATTNGPHCDDVLVNGVPSINGFPIQCPRGEGDLSTTDPFGTSNDGYGALALVNRFDLAPKNGSNCGQYRVVYGKRSGQLGDGNDRVLIIFEGVLPNPNTGAGIVGCLPVAKFWDDLTNDGDVTSRATKLHTFFFTGITGFAPVIQAAHYGIGGGTNTGQIRGNLFRNAEDPADLWQLREWHLAQSCKSTGCSLIAKNVPVADNPFGGLFAGTDAASQQFQTEFISQVPHLAAKTLTGIGMFTPAPYVGGESDEQQGNNDYGDQGGSNGPLLTAISAKLAAIGRSDLTALNILDRATTQSCAGCHELSRSKNIGGGLTWPDPNLVGFTQINERQQLSDALTFTFLPFRATILQNFINANCPGSGGTPAGGDPSTTLGGSAVGAPN